MKKRILAITIVLITFQAQAQYIRDKLGDVIPFSCTEKYKDIVRTDVIHSLVLPSYNNDSLFVMHNNGKSCKDVGSSFAVGFAIDTVVKFMDYAKKIEIDEGTLWILTIESETAQGIGINILKISLPKGVYFSVYPGTIPGIMEDPAVGFSDDIDCWTTEKGGNAYVHDKKIVTEFFVPHGLEYKPDVIINRITYGFQGFGKPGNKFDYEKMKEEHDNGTSGLMLNNNEYSDNSALTCQTKRL